MMVGADGLFGGGDQVLVLGRAGHLVELLVEVAQLGHLGHERLVHHKGRLQKRRTPRGQKLHCIRDQGLRARGA
eukprot:scaffold6876_cov109-Isochrysis_galbana.AAC.3